MRVFLKLTAFILGLLCFFLTTLPLLPWLQRDPQRVRPMLTRQVSRYARFVRWLLGLSVEVTGDESSWNSRGGHLIVANHMSYLDVVLLASTRPACFVTSTDIKKTFGLGHIVQLAGCLFVNRKDKSGLGQEVKELSDALAAGLDVVVFPEATSTNGEAILRFRKPLFSAALAVHAPVLPVTINYVSADGEAVSRRNRDSLCWYGDMDFVPHFLTLAALKGAHFKFHVHAPVTAIRDVTELAHYSETRVREHFNPILSQVV